MTKQGGFDPRHKQIVRAFSEWIFSVMVDHCRGRYRVPGFDPRLKVCFRKSRAYSWGGADADGKPFVNIAASSIMWMIPERKSVKVLHEYEFLRYADDIGPISGSWKIWMAATIAHEIAHALHWYIDTPDGSHAKQMIPAPARDDGDDHGRLWQALYRDLRLEFVNGIDYPIGSVDQPATPDLRRYRTRYDCVEERKYGGRCVTYRKGDIAVILLKKTGHLVQRMDPSTGEFQDTSWMKLVDARRELVDLILC